MTGKVITCSHSLKLACSGANPSKKCKKCGYCHCERTNCFLEKVPEVKKVHGVKFGVGEEFPITLVGKRHYDYGKKTDKLPKVIHNCKSATHSERGFGHVEKCSCNKYICVGCKSFHLTHSRKHPKKS